MPGLTVCGPGAAIWAKLPHVVAGVPRCSARPQSPSRCRRCPSSPGLPAVRQARAPSGRSELPAVSAVSAGSRHPPKLQRKQSRQTWWGSRVNPDMLECRRPQGLLRTPCTSIVVFFAMVESTYVTVVPYPRRRWRVECGQSRRERVICCSLYGESCLFQGVVSPVQGNSSVAAVFRSMWQRGP